MLKIARLSGKATPEEMSPPMSGILDTPEIEQLLTLVEEAARSSEAGVMHFVEPAPGTLRRAAGREGQVFQSRMALCHLRNRGLAES